MLCKQEPAIKNQEPRCQEPKNKGKRKPRIQKKEDKKINFKSLPENCKGSRYSETFAIEFYVFFFWFLASWFLVLDSRFLLTKH